MDWENYRKLLGIKSDDNQRFLKCENIILNELENYFDHLNYDIYPNPEIICDEDYKKFCNVLGIRKTYCEHNEQYRAIYAELFNRKHNFKEFVACLVAFINSMSKHSDVEKKELIKILENAFDSSNIGFEVIEKDDENYFIIPCGAKELDDILIVDTLIWLKDYKETHKLYSHTLTQYANKEEPRDVADNLRKTLETFLQEFFNNKKILEKNISEVGKFFDSKEVYCELKNIFTSLMTGYNKANNGIAKHRNNANENMLEFLVYQTGIFIRTIIVLNKC